jgi:hypothetical protein
MLERYTPFSINHERRLGGLPPASGCTRTASPSRRARDTLASMTPTPEPRSADADALTAHQFAKQSGLAPDLVTLFIPATDSPTGRAYSRDHFPLARVVKNMADSGAPPMTIRAAVRDLADRTPLEVESLGAPTTPWQNARRQRRRNTTLTIGFALIGGAGLGASLTYGITDAPSTSTVVQTLTVSAPPAQLTPTVSSHRDPICDEWETATRTFASQQDAWNRIDPTLAAAQWNSQQRATAMTTAPMIREEAATMRQLASRTDSPFLRVLLRGQAVYEDAFADRMPTYKTWPRHPTLAGRPDLSRICRGRVHRHHPRLIPGHQRWLHAQSFAGVDSPGPVEDGLFRRHPSGSKGPAAVFMRRR